MTEEDEANTSTVSVMEDEAEAGERLEPSHWSKLDPKSMKVWHGAMYP